MGMPPAVLFIVPQHVDTTISWKPGLGLSIFGLKRFIEGLLAVDGLTCLSVNKSMFAGVTATV